MIELGTKQMAALEMSRRHPTPFAVTTRPRYAPASFHWTIGDCLASSAKGITKRLIISVPPQHGKSELTSRSFPAWYLGRYPRSKLILSSYSAKLARDFGRSCRNTISLPGYRRLFPNAILSRELGTSADEWGLENGSFFLATGVRGGSTGFGANIFVVDDPIKGRLDADSAIYRESLKDWFREVVLGRLTPTGTIIIVATRWHYDDLIGWILREWADESWFYLRLPAIQDRDPDSLDRRKPGEALWPSYYNLDVLKNRREEVGPLAWNALYQQVPSLHDGAVLKLSWIVHDFDLTGGELPGFDRIVISWDTAFEKHARADFSVGTVWGERGGSDFYLLDVYRGRWNFPELKKIMRASAEKYAPDAVLVEKAASGRDILHELREETALPLIPVKVESDKIRRADAVSGRFEAGRVHFPRSAPWLADVLQEIEQFPRGAHDDQVDSITQAVRWMTRNAGRFAAVA